MKYTNEVGSPGLVRESPAERFHLPVESLRNEELLAVLIACPVEKAREIIENNSLVTLGNTNYDELTRIVSRKRARILLSAFELSQRIFHKGPAVVPAICCPEDSLPFLWDIREKDREHFACLYLNARNQMVHQEIISIGSLSASIVHPREVFSVAIEKRAANIILGHNHPSGNPEPSKEDIELTKRLKKAGEILGIEIIDHIVVSQTDFTSVKEKGLI